MSKGAAAKRYERMMRANGIHPSGGSIPATPPSSSSRGGAGMPNARQPKVPRLAGPTPTRKPRAATKKKGKTIDEDRDMDLDDEEDDMHSGAMQMAPPPQQQHSQLAPIIGQDQDLPMQGADHSQSNSFAVAQTGGTAEQATDGQKMGGASDNASGASTGSPRQVEAQLGQVYIID